MNWGILYPSTQTKTWTQPKLSGSNGTWEGNSFAVQASVEYSSSYALWKAFDSDVDSSEYLSNHYGNNGSLSEANDWIKIYNPNPICITYFGMTNRESHNNGITEGKVYGSNDDSTFDLLKSFTNSNTTAKGTWGISLSSNTAYYKYYKLAFTQYGGTTTQRFGFINITITATEISSGGSSASFPYAHYSTDSYSCGIAYFGASPSNSYLQTKTSTGFSLYKNSSASKIYYTTLGY